MATPQKRKRQRAQKTSPANITERPAKKIKTRSEIELDAWASWKYPPEFWDRLSKISLTHRALEEHDRRVSLRHPPRAFTTATTVGDLARFARHGGPDLSDLRGCPQPPVNCPPTAMSASQSPRSRRTKSTAQSSTLPTSTTTKTTKTKRSTPYDRDFDLHLTDHRVHPVYSSQEPDLTEVMAAVAIPRPSLSPSKFSDGAFRTFRESNARAKDEDDVLANVVPTILGPGQTAHPSARNTVFGNLEPLTDGTIAPAKPDIYYGTYPEELSRPVRDELAHHIIPSTMQDKPLAPNFFIEAKGPDGSAAVATRQARYDGAIGSRAIHSLQHYGNEAPDFDGRPYTYTSTYHDGLLKLYAHHVTAPTSGEGESEYHMTQVDTWGLTGNVDSFRRGVTAFRNARDLAKRHRDHFIQAANATALQSSIVTGQAHASKADHLQYPASLDVDHGLQQIITGTGCESEENNENVDADADAGKTCPISHHLENDEQEPSPDSLAPSDDVSRSFISSLTSDSMDQSHSKRSRTTPSPPSRSTGGHMTKRR